jgi:DNA polymerase-3 subunit delta'
MQIPYFWQEKAWQMLRCRIDANRLPHALLVTGPAGMGKEAFAQLLAAALLCTRDGGGALPCACCAACKLCRAETHPDLRVIRLEQGAKEIRIDAIREVCASLTLSAARGGHKVAVVLGAERMNRYAANSFLKTLEEPLPGTVIILVSERAYVLPVTIRSRCQEIRFLPPPSEQVLPWLRRRTDHPQPEVLLALAGGAPLRALAMSGEDLGERAILLQELSDLVDGRSDPSVLAARWVDLGAHRCVDWLLGWTIDMIKIRGGAGAAQLGNEDLKGPLERLAQQFPTRKLFSRYDDLLSTGKWLDTSVGQQGLLEGVLIGWVDAGRLARPKTGERCA